MPAAAGRRPRLLDVGCGSGAFLLEARRRGYDVTGVELDGKSAAAARAAGLPDIRHAALDHLAAQAARSGERFDIITFWEVLEHQTDPRAFVRQAKSLLAPGGVLVGSVPNRERLMADRDRANDDYDHPPHHWLWFSPSALAALFAAEGLAEVNLGKPPYSLWDFSKFLLKAFCGGLTAKVGAFLARRARRRQAAGNGASGKSASWLAAADFARNLLFCRSLFCCFLC